MTCLSMKFYSFLFFFWGGGTVGGGSAEDDLDLGILLPPPPKCWDDRSIEGYTSFYVVLGIESGNHMY